MAKQDKARKQLQSQGFTYTGDVVLLGDRRLKFSHPDGRTTTVGKSGVYRIR